MNSDSDRRPGNQTCSRRSRTKAKPRDVPKTAPILSRGERAIYKLYQRRTTPKLRIIRDVPERSRNRGASGKLCNSSPVVKERGTRSEDGQSGNHSLFAKCPNEGQKLTDHEHTLTAVRFFTERQNNRIWTTDWHRVCGIMVDLRVVRTAGRDGLGRGRITYYGENPLPPGRGLLGRRVGQGVLEHSSRQEPDPWQRLHSGIVAESPVRLPKEACAPKSLSASP